MNVEIGYDEAMMPTMLCDPAKSTATKIGNLNGNRGLHMYIYIHMHNVHNKSAPCLFQIVTAFSKSAKHFGKERKKQHINNIHCEGPPPQFKFRNRETWASQKFEPCPAANPASVVDIYIIYDIIYLYI